MSHASDIAGSARAGAASTERRPSTMPGSLRSARTAADATLRAATQLP